MKKLFLFVAIFAFAAVSAQNYTLPQTVGVNAEPVRSAVTPYDCAAKAVAGDDSASTYVRGVAAEWTRREEGGIVEFSSRFAMPLSWLNRQVILRVEPMAMAYEVSVNGRVAGYTQSGAVPTEFNITGFAVKDRNDITLTCIAGLPGAKFRPAQEVRTPEVRIISQPSLRVRDVVLNTTLNENGDGVAEFGVAMKCNTLNAKSSRVRLTLSAPDGAVLFREYRDITLSMRGEDTLRFAARVPAGALWSPEHPNLLRLDVENRVDGRFGEAVSCRVGARAVEVRKGELCINGVPVQLRTAEYTSSTPLDRFVSSGINTLVVTAGEAPASLYGECDRRGVLIISRAAIDTTPFGTSIAVGGNPTNAPEWRDTFIARNEENLYFGRLHPSVVGFMLGRGNTTGVNIYDAYLRMKALSPVLPVLYDGAGGEWCTDILHRE